MARIRPGLLTDKVQPESKTTSDSYGEPTATWAKDGSTLWGHLKRQSGRERIRTGRISDAQAASLTLRYQGASSITSDQRFAIGGEVWEIQGPPTEIGRRAYLEFVVTLNEHATPAT